MEETILVVDDSKTVLSATARTLQSQGFRVLTATDGEHALAIARRERPTLIVLDIIMPKINGFEVCRQLKSDPGTKDIKILLFSCKNQDSDRFWGMRQGADCYMTKPFEDDELLETITDLIGN